MPNPLKKQWLSFKRGEPGHRFQDRYATGKKAQKGAGWGFRFLRIFRVLAALGLLAIGFVLMFIPGPAILFFLIAGSLLATESKLVARFLDWGEVKVRKMVTWSKRHWKKLHVALKVTLAGLVMCVAAGFAYGAYRIIAE